MVDHGTFMKARDKSETIRIALRCGIPCPVTVFPEDGNLGSLAEQLPLPALVKPNIASGARGITPVNRREDLEANLGEQTASLRTD